MTRHACVIEDQPLPDPDDEDVLGMMPRAGVVPIVAVDSAGASLGAVWTFHHDPPLRLDAAGACLPELCIGVAPGSRGAGIGGLLLDALFVHSAPTRDATCANVHVRNPAQHLYHRKGFETNGRGRGPLGLAMRKDLIGNREVAISPIDQRQRQWDATLPHGGHFARTGGIGSGNGTAFTRRPAVSAVVAPSVRQDR